MIGFALREADLLEPLDPWERLAAKVVVVVGEAEPMSDSSGMLSGIVIQLTYSNRTEKLLDALAADLSRAREAGRSPFEPVRLVVPNRNVEVWLKHGLARRTGIAANLEIHLLRRFVGGLLADADQGARLVDGGLLLDLVLSLLLDDDYLGRPELARLRSYLHAAGGSAEAVDLRRFQLAAELSRLFEEYGYSRPEMIGGWPREAILAGTIFEETEGWQRRIWLDLFGKGGLAETRGAAEGVRYWHLPQLLDRLGELPFGDGAPIYLLGVSYVASAFHRILSRLANDNELHVYALNPCMEFWEDVEASHEARKRLSKRIRLGASKLLEEDPFKLLGGGDNPALSLWGRPGRENIRLLNELADCDFRAVFEEPAGERPSLLRQLQQDILERKSEDEVAQDKAERLKASGGVGAVDASLEILACPGIRREAEAIAESIWELVHADASAGGDEPLRFNDIAVLVAGSDPQLYFTHLAAVFEETYGIPYNRSGSSFASESRVAEAIELLLALPKGRFTRAEVLGFVTHPNVIGAWPDADPAEWARWTERLGIVRGADRDDLAGSYVEEDLLSWDQGLRRMALGAFLIESRDGEALPFDVGADRYLPVELPPQAIASMGMQLRQLLSDLRALQGASLRPAAWAVLLGEVVERHLIVRSEGEERELEQALRAIRGLADLDLDGRTIGYTIASELAAQALGGIGGVKGQYLAGGVVVSTLQPMRAIPFRAIFVAGLGEQRFPSADRRNHLDLRLARPRLGDVSQREGDQYMFLEALLCAREKLVLSYVARDQLTGDPLLPSPLLVELERMLEKGYADRPLKRELPLRRFDDPGAFASPQALREAQTVELQRDLRRQLGLEPASALSRPDLESILEGVSADRRGALLRHLGLREEFAGSRASEARRRKGAPPMGSRAEGIAPARLAAPSARPQVNESFTGEEAPLSLSLQALRGFLECPLQGSAGILLGLRRDEGGSPASLESEPFEVSSLERSIFLEGRFLAAVAREGEGGLALEEVYDEGAAIERLAGRFPLGAFGAAERSRHLADLSAWAETYDAVASGGARGLEVLRFGPADVGGVSDRILDRISFDVQLPTGERRRVELRGKTSPMFVGRRASLILRSPSDAYEPTRLKLGLRGFFDHVALCASGEREGHVVHFCPSRKGKALAPIAFAPLETDVAIGYLRQLVEELFAGVHDYLLPCEAVFAAHADPEASLAEAVAKLTGPWARSSSTYGPVRGADQYPPPGEEEGRKMIERRFGLYFTSQSAGSSKSGGRP